MNAAALSKFDLTGRKALVTGGGSGLGMHMAQALARAGATVMIGGRREGALADAASKIMSEPDVGKVRYRAVDLSNGDDVTAFADHAVEAMGGVDIFVGNAAQLTEVPLPELSVEAMRDNLDVNIIANIQLVKKLVPGMRERHWGRIILSSSVNSLGGARSNTTIYAAAKAALNSLAREFATEFGRDNITANALVLGFWWSDMVQIAVENIRKNAGEDAVKQMISHIAGSIPLGRLGNPEELHGVINLLASEAGSYITGSSLVIDGGLTTMMFPNPVAEPDLAGN